MSHEQTATGLVNLRCPICGTSAKIEIPPKFECLNCGRTNEVTVATDRVTGPIVWLAGDSKLPR
jgi:transcription elongation factor Elf1